MNMRSRIKNNDQFIFRLLRSIYYYFRHFTIPASKFVWYPIWIIVNFLREIFYWILSTFWITPIFKGILAKTGKNFRAGTFLPFVVGKGNIICGDRVRIHGKIDFIFGSIKQEIPQIYIGNNTSIGHNVTFDISGILKIGSNCLIASNVTFQDCSGHSIDPDERMARIPPRLKDVRPIRIGNNVWIGDGVYLMPGTIVGDNCVISAKTVVNRSIPENHLAYSANYKTVKIRNISKII